jgi:Predicted transcriptional regulator
MINHILRGSLEQGSIVTIIYTKENQITKRNIQVLELTDSYVKAFCHLRKQRRVFKLENILAADYYRGKVLV